MNGVVGERQRRDQGACDLLAQNPISRNDHSFRPIVVREAPRRGEDNREITVVTPVQALAVVANDGGQVVGQLAAPPQVPTLDEAIPVPPPLNPPAAPGQVGAANNAARARAHAAHRFLANAATAGVGQPFVVDEADAAAMRRPRRIDNMDAIDGLNRAMNDTVRMIAESLGARARGTATAAAGRDGGGESAEIDRKLESLHKRRKLAIDVGDQVSIAHINRMSRILEEKEAREMEGAGGN